MRQVDTLTNGNPKPLDTYTKSRETRDLWRHICYSKVDAILEIVPICGKFLLISL